MVMGNASSRKDGESPSGVNNTEYEEGYGAHGSYFEHGANPEPMVHSPPHSPGTCLPPLLSAPQVPTAPVLRPGDIFQVRNHAFMQNTTYCEDVLREKRQAAMIVWSYGGKQVAVTGSWDNWRTIEPLHNVGKDFIIMKLLPKGVYQYRFIVDEQLRYAPELPWESDDLGSAYNILQVAIAPLARPVMTMQVPNHEVMQSSNCSEDVLREKRRATTITWSHGGKQVAITGSWDNWRTIEPLHSLGKDFILIKMLPEGVYHYRFIVDDQLRYAPDLPWESDDSGSAYNILDLEEYVPEAPESLSEFESPPSPPLTYDNQTLKDDDFSKPPPELPPQLQVVLLNKAPSATGVDQSLPRPQHAVLNHFYIQDNDRGQAMALSSTHRFRQKYVTVVLYKPSKK